MPDTPSPKHGLVRPADTDFINAWPSQVRSIVDYLDPRIATIITGAPRPAAGVVGRFHKADDGTLTFDDGTNWVELPNVPLQSADIGDAQVTNAKLGDDAVDAAKIAAGA